MSFKDASPSDSFLCLLKFNHHLLILSILLLLDIPDWLLTIYYTWKLVLEVRRSIFEAHCQLFRFDVYLKNWWRLNIWRQWRKFDVAEDGVERFVPLVDSSILIYIWSSLFFHLSGTILSYVNYKSNHLNCIGRCYDIVIYNAMLYSI